MCDCGMDHLFDFLNKEKNNGSSGSPTDPGRRSLLLGTGATLLAASLPLAFSGKAHAATPGKFRVGYIAEPAHGLHFLARDKGYFKEQGLDVEFFQFKSSAEGLIALRSGKLDIGTFGSAAPLVFISQGTPFTIFGGMMLGGQAVITRPEQAQNLKSLENYRGKKIAINRLSTGDIVFRQALQKAGFDPETHVTRVEFPSPGAIVEAVIKGQADAGIVFSPHFSLAEKRGMAVTHFLGDFLPSYTCCRLTANTADYNARKDEYGRFLTALIKAYKIYKTDQEETVRVFTKELKIDEDVIRKDTYTRQAFESHPDPLKKGTLEFWKAMVESAGYVTNKTYPVEQHIDIDLYKQSLDALIAQNPGDEIYASLLDFYRINNT